MNKPWLNREWLYEQYVVQKKPRKQLAKECGISESTLKTHLYEKRIVRNKNLITKEELELSYQTKKLTFLEMSSQFECSEVTIREYLKKYDIPKRKSHMEKYQEEDIELMRYLYCDELMSANQISKIFKTSHKVVLKHLRNIGIETRDGSQAQWNFNKKEYPSQFLDKDYLFNLYVTESKTLKEIGNLYNCDGHTIKYFLKLNKIPLKKKDYSNCELVKLSRSFLSTSINPKIRERDKNCCQLCGKKEELHVHHIKPLKKILLEIKEENEEIFEANNIEEMYKIVKNDKRFLDKNNLITYCKDCHFYKIHNYKRQSASKPVN